MRLLVCGGRDYTDKAAAWAALDRAHRKRAVSLVIHGAARGADTLGAAWAQERGIPVQAFPGGSGTADMVRRARAAGVVVWVPYGGVSG